MTPNTPPTSVSVRRRRGHTRNTADWSDPGFRYAQTCTASTPVPLAAARDGSPSPPHKTTTPQYRPVAGMCRLIAGALRSPSPSKPTGRYLVQRAGDRAVGEGHDACRSQLAARSPSCRTQSAVNCAAEEGADVRARYLRRLATPTNSGRSEARVGYTHTCTASTPVPLSAPRSAAQPAAWNTKPTASDDAGVSRFIAGHGCVSAVWEGSPAPTPCARSVTVLPMSHPHSSPTLVEINGRRPRSFMVGLSSGALRPFSGSLEPFSTL